jgi:two-component system cell cycle response regulator
VAEMPGWCGMPHREATRREAPPRLHIVNPRLAPSATLRTSCARALLARAIVQTQHAQGPSEHASTMRIPVRLGALSSRTGYETPVQQGESTPSTILSVDARPTVSVLNGVAPDCILPLEAPSLVIGRSAKADLQIEDCAVSRLHARISRTPDGAFRIEDLGSTNGTFLGSRRVTVAPLRTGDRVQLGPTALLRFALTDPADEQMQVGLSESVIRDPLTKAFNRRYLLGRLLVEVARARRLGTPLAVLMLDVDGFKQFNSRHGHFVGDRVLCVATAQIGRLLQVGDVLARFGGDEFVVLGRDTSAARARALADRLRRAVGGMRMSAGGVPVSVTISVGIASLEELRPRDAPEDLVNLADQRLCSAKRAGCDRVSAEGD